MTEPAAPFVVVSSGAINGQLGDPFNSLQDAVDFGIAEAPDIPGIGVTTIVLVYAMRTIPRVGRVSVPVRAIYGNEAP